MNKKRTAKVALATFGLSVMLPTAALAATDTQGHWAGSVLAKWESQALISGYEDGTIRPDYQISRAEFVALVNRVAGYQAAGSSVSFKDVKSGDWYAAQVAIAVKEGYIGGFEDNTFRPNDSVTRAQAAAVLARIKNLSADAGRAEQFSDATAIPSWAKGVVGAVANAGYMVGDESNKFNAEKALTRAEAVASLDRVFGVKELAAQSLTLSATEGVFNKLASRTITATSSVEGAVITAVSSDTDVATVTVDGNKVTIKGVDKGSATITVTAKADGYKVATATYKVDITAAVGGGGGGGSSYTPSKDPDPVPLPIDKEQVENTITKEATKDIDDVIASVPEGVEIPAAVVKELKEKAADVAKTVAQKLNAESKPSTTGAPTTTLVLPTEKVTVKTEDGVEITTTIETIVETAEVKPNTSFSVVAPGGKTVPVTVEKAIVKDLTNAPAQGALITVKDIKESCDQASQDALAEKLGFDSLEDYTNDQQSLVTYTKVEKADGTFDVEWDFGKAEISAVEQEKLMKQLNVAFGVKVSTTVYVPEQK